jgi:hypothetical protein
MVGVKRGILYVALPILLTTCLSSHRTVPQRSLYESDSSRVETFPRTSVKIASGQSGRDYAIGISLESGNRLEIYGFSTSEGAKKISCHKDEQGRNIADSSFGF